MKKGQFMTMTLYKISAHIYPKNINCRTKVNHLLCAHNIPAGVIMNINIYPPPYLTFFTKRKANHNAWFTKGSLFRCNRNLLAGLPLPNRYAKAGPLKVKALTFVDFQLTGMA